MAITLLIISTIGAVYAVIHIIYTMVKGRSFKQVLSSTDFKILLISVVVTFCLLFPWSKIHLSYGDSSANSTTQQNVRIEPVAKKEIKDSIKHPIKEKNIPEIKIQKKDSNESIKAEKEISPIVNNGNLSVGQQGGTVNQNNYNVAELPDRQINEEDMEYFRSVIKHGYTIDFTIITSGSQETQDFGMKLLGYMKQNYTVTNSTIIGMSSVNRRKGNKRYYVDINDEKKIISVLVQSQN